VPNASDSLDESAIRLCGSVIGHGRIDVRLQEVQWNFFTECFNPFGGTIEHVLQQGSPFVLPQGERRQVQT
jgi:hypothetical protein